MSSATAKAVRRSCSTRRIARPLVAEAGQQAGDLGDHGRGETVGGLVEEQEPGVQQQGSGDGEQLLLAAGELVGAVAALGELGEELVGPGRGPRAGGVAGVLHVPAERCVHPGLGTCSPTLTGPPSAPCRSCWRLDPQPVARATVSPGGGGERETAGQAPQRTPPARQALGAALDQPVSQVGP
jgi:hypothetical protein